MPITPVNDKFFAYVEPHQVIAAAMIAGFKDVPVPGLTIKDVKGRTWVDYHEATMVGAIALAESSGNLFTTHANPNGSVDMGVLQINTVHEALITPLVSPFTLVGAAQLAYQVYVDAGRKFTPWNCTQGSNPQVANWYYEELGLTRLRYASDGVAKVRSLLREGKSLNQITRIDLRDFTPYR